MSPVKMAPILATKVKMSPVIMSPILATYVKISPVKMALVRMGATKRKIENTSNKKHEHKNLELRLYFPI